MATKLSITGFYFDHILYKNVMYIVTEQKTSAGDYILTFRKSTNALHTRFTKEQKISGKYPHAEMPSLSFEPVIDKDGVETLHLCVLGQTQEAGVTNGLKAESWDGGVTWA